MSQGYNSRPKLGWRDLLLSLGLVALSSLAVLSIIIAALVSLGGVALCPFPRRPERASSALEILCRPLSTARAAHVLLVAVECGRDLAAATF
jgi:hypothetical protein